MCICALTAFVVSLIWHALGTEPLYPFSMVWAIAVWSADFDVTAPLVSPRCFGSYIGCVSGYSNFSALCGWKLVYKSRPVYGESRYHDLNYQRHWFKEQLCLWILVYRACDAQGSKCPDSGVLGLLHPTTCANVLRPTSRLLHCACCMWWTTIKLIAIRIGLAHWRRRSGNHLL